MEISNFYCQQIPAGSLLSVTPLPAIKLSNLTFCVKYLHISHFFRTFALVN